MSLIERIDRNTAGVIYEGRHTTGRERLLDTVVRGMRPKAIEIRKKEKRSK
jgi:hypothetical protein